jgi:hypothetical protein
MMQKENKMDSKNKPSHGNLPSDLSSGKGLQDAGQKPGDMAESGIKGSSQHRTFTKPRRLSQQDAQTMPIDRDPDDPVSA